MLNADLGYRAPIEDCPTRVNPEIKKAYARQDSFNTPKKPVEKLNSYSVAELARKLGIDANAFKYRAMKLTSKPNTNLLYDDEIMMVYNDLKVKPIRRAAKRKVNK